MAAAAATNNNKPTMLVFEAKSNNYSTIEYMTQEEKMDDETKQRHGSHYKRERLQLDGC